MKKEFTLESGKKIIGLVFKPDGQDTYMEVFRSNFENQDEIDEFVELAQQGEVDPETNETINQISDIRFIERDLPQE
jgi:uncharacterized protein with von Willebrand factor type A (vWA) domain